MPPEGDLGHGAFHRWKGNGKKSTVGHLNPYDSDVDSEVSFSHSTSIY